MTANRERNKNHKLERKKASGTSYIEQVSGESPLTDAYMLHSLTQLKSRKKTGVHTIKTRHDFVSVDPKKAG